MRTLTFAIFFLMSYFLSATSQAASGRGGDGPDPLSLQETFWKTSDGRFALSLSKCHGSVFRCQVDFWDVQKHSVLATGRVISSTQSNRDRTFLIDFADVAGNPFQAILQLNEHRTISLMLSENHSSVNFDLLASDNCR